MMRTRNALRAAPWLAGTAVVVFSATVTLSVLGRDLLGTKATPMTRAEVRQRLAHYGNRPAMMSGPAGRHHAAPGAAAVPDAKTYQGNIVYAACDKGQVTLTFIPAMSYRMTGDVPGPAPVTFVRFSAGSPDTTVTVTVTCAHGAPAFRAVTGKAGTAAVTGTSGTQARTGTGTAGTGTAVSRPAGGNPAGTASAPPAATASSPPADGGGDGGHGGGGGGGGGGGPSPGGSPSPAVTASPGGHGS